ncbi:sugar kinase [Ruegeria sp. Ofav3-42]|uniref:sugar kinase n=1 Tax=Ruegeria sp. Ofav3-42 TaxID=2917759 RepID=UPI001EF3E41C|nr:sugar kinase [Ruegeria sp. Ofav3-42]MCG7521439.1 sugar kinase [Ruegeria sp. Ofav3-42]
MPLPKRPLHRIACLGEVMIELIAGPDNTASLGVAGDTYNTAVYLSRCLRDSAHEISYVTALGSDPYSDRIVSEMRSHGIDASFVERRENQMPGLYAIETDAEGERSFHYWRSAAAARSLFQSPCKVTLESLHRFDLVNLSGISMAILPQTVRDQIIGWVDVFRENGGTIAYDSNYRPRLWESVHAARQINDAMWARADIALPSADDEMSLYGEASAEEVVNRLRTAGVTRGALKQGADGPMDLFSGDTLFQTEPVAKVVDSTAAGDSFNAGYLAALARGESSLEAVRAGHELAAQVIQHPGAIVTEIT